MGQVAPQLWTDTSKVGEPVFEISYSSRICIITIAVTRHCLPEVESFLTALTAEFWRYKNLRDMKILKSHNKDEFMIITSWELLRTDLATVQDEKLNTIQEALQPLILTGAISIKDMKEDDYFIIE